MLKALLAASPAGHEVTVFDLDPEAIKRLASAGAKPTTSPREAAKGNKFVLTMVPDDQVSKEVWLDSDKGALAGMEPKAVAIETSTVTPV